MQHLKMFEDFSDYVITSRDDVFMIEKRLDRDTNIVYGKCLNGDKAGEEFLELYVGSNYNIDSKLKSYSRHYTVDRIPSKYDQVFLELKTYAEKHYPFHYSPKLVNLTKDIGALDLD